MCIVLGLLHSKIQYKTKLLSRDLCKEDIAHLSCVAADIPSVGCRTAVVYAVSVLGASLCHHHPRVVVYAVARRSID